ncbi:ferredoxin reductase-like protein [Ramicandelaber brevisporus]|nr:ferredoxin reductase-like protein [Ramicandelaber brevisporus]
MASSKDQNKKLKTLHLISGHKWLQAWNYQDFKLVKITYLTSDTAIFRFALPDPEADPEFPLTTFILTRFKSEGWLGWFPPYRYRYYTPIVDLKTKGHFDLLLKHYPDGLTSPRLFKMQVGDMLNFRGPFVHYPIEKNMFKELGMVAAGVGIAPMMGLLNVFLNDPNETTKLTLLFSSRTTEDFYYKQEIDEYADKFPDRFKVHYTLTAAKNVPEGWSGRVGRIDDNMLRETMPAPANKDVMVFACGSEEFVAAVGGPFGLWRKQGPAKGMLGRLGYAPEQIFKF